MRAFSTRTGARFIRPVSPKAKRRAQTRLSYVGAWAGPGCGKAGASERPIYAGSRIQLVVSHDAPRAGAIIAPIESPQRSACSTVGLPKFRSSRHVRLRPYWTAFFYEIPPRRRLIAGADERGAAFGPPLFTPRPVMTPRRSERCASKCGVYGECLCIANLTLTIRYLPSSG